MLRKANQKRLLDNVVIQEGEFNTETLAKRIDWRDMLDEGGKIGDVEVAMDADEGAGGKESGREVERAFLEAEDEEDRQAALAAREEMFVDETDFGDQQQHTEKEKKRDESSSLCPQPQMQQQREKREEKGSKRTMMRTKAVLWTITCWLLLNRIGTSSPDRGGLGIFSSFVLYQTHWPPTT